MMKQQIQFLKHFLRNPNKVGAVTALNNTVGKEIIKYAVNPKCNQPKKILEVGAGYGNISKLIANNIREQDTLDIVEVDTKCCEKLQHLFCGHDNVNVHCKSIIQWEPNYKYDFIISTLPFNSYPIEFVRNVIERYMSITAKGAILSYVEYTGLLKIRKSIAQGEKRSMMEARKEYLDTFQIEHLFDKKCVFNNIPPCNVYHLRLSD